ncbi:tRNA(Met) cytidine acetyltransferase TmcA [Vibrio sp. SCSIO 43137]|uniref:tRNA(Met) cytidine acetyltransferase TmcA n=1 Tax=Vibrio sp. SCSIO 43137 TaxID=3021011 RepID=UPI002306E48A|nr:GNAT family N-acetyltransferase [Vibrio sp. SCSIO 43137]WCE31989.1 GNAT family N-acetyltransferase [Vibrio sp. SCSIO 43137]
MNLLLQQLFKLTLMAEQQNHRFLVRLKGSIEWQQALVSQFAQLKHYSDVITLGTVSIDGAMALNYKQGSAVLGMESDCLFYDSSGGFDANSFTAASGTLKGGGVMFINFTHQGTVACDWIEQQLANAICIEQDSQEFKQPNPIAEQQTLAPFYEQKKAVELIKKVATGHRKRPLVLTADRGRGKSSALGIAAATLMKERNIRILITAPARKAVDPLFKHAIQLLPDTCVTDKNSIRLADSSLSFVSPDELELDKHDCDLLMIDEAAAIPLPLLISLTSRYHRTVFSSTVHGYEGCGRGFTVKFYPWLDKHNPGWKGEHLSQAIRWNENDPLESWVFQSFLLNAELSPLNLSAEASQQKADFQLIPKQQLLNKPALLTDCFSLLVNAHYQTTPNDLMQLLEDDSVHLFTSSIGEQLVGCVIAKQEGGINGRLVDDITCGVRRPKGHLVPALIASQMGMSNALKCKGLRIMRIAVSPQLQNKGFGTELIQQLYDQNPLGVDYLSTSYGVTAELFSFWQNNSFEPVKLGSRRDHASGTHSLLMLRVIRANAWHQAAFDYFMPNLISLLPDTFSQLDPKLVIALLRGRCHKRQPLPENYSALIRLYAQGGSSYESAFFALQALLLDTLTNNRTQPSPLLVSKILQRKSWAQISSEYQLTGRKQSEAEVRKSLLSLL